MSTLLSVSVALLAGLLMTRVFKPFKLPSVTAYLIAGVLIGPYCIGRVGFEGIGFTSAEAVERLGLVSEVALGFIAFSIGSEFRLSELKKTGKQAFVIGIFQALVATLFVDLALVGIHYNTTGDYSWCNSYCNSSGGYLDGCTSVQSERTSYQVASPNSCS